MMRSLLESLTQAVMRASLSMALLMVKPLRNSPAYPLLAEQMLLLILLLMLLVTMRQSCNHRATLQTITASAMLTVTTR